MGLLQRLFGEKVKQAEKAATSGAWETLTAYRPVFHSWQGGLYESELVRSAIDARARHISKLRMEFVGAAKPKLLKRLNKRPNDFQTWSQFLYRTSTILDMQNTAFIIPTIGEYGEFTGLFTVLPSSCEVVKDARDNPWIRYQFRNGEHAAIELSNVGILTKFQYEDDLFGTSNRVLHDTMQLIAMQKQGIEEAIESSATYRFIAQLSNFSSPEDLRKERERFTAENLSRDANGGGLLLFPNTYKDIQQMKSSPYTVDADQMRLIQTNVFNYFGVNERILQNIATPEEWGSFYEGAVEPFAIPASEVLTQLLFTDIEQSNGSKALATTNRLQYMSAKDKLAVSQGMADRGLMTRNEVREIWNLPPIEGGDVATIRGEYYLIDDKGIISEEDTNDDSTGED